MRYQMRASGPFAKLLAIIGGAILLLLAFMFSLIVLPIVFAIGLGFFGWLWWQTRKLRRHLRDNPPPGWGKPPVPDGQVIEGEATVVGEEMPGERRTD